MVSVMEPGLLARRHVPEYVPLCSVAYVSAQLAFACCQLVHASNRATHSPPPSRTRQDHRERRTVPNAVMDAGNMHVAHGLVGDDGIGLGITWISCVGDGDAPTLAMIQVLHGLC